MPVRFKDVGVPGLCSPGIWVNNIPTTTNRAAYARDPFGFVHLRGIVSTCNGAGQTIFKLPAGFRPAKLESMTDLGFSGGASAVQVTPGGRVQSSTPMVNRSTGSRSAAPPPGSTAVRRRLSFTRWRRREILRGRFQRAGVADLPLG